MGNITCVFKALWNKVHTTFSSTRKFNESRTSCGNQRFKQKRNVYEHKNSADHETTEPENYHT